MLHTCSGSNKPCLGRHVGSHRGVEVGNVQVCTFAHHLEPQQLVEFVDGALEVARIAVLVNDLRRNAVHLALVYLGFPLFRSRITRHDGPVSVRRSYTTEEMLEMLRRTRAARVQAENYYLDRVGAIAWKKK